MQWFICLPVFGDSMQPSPTSTSMRPLQVKYRWGHETRLKKTPHSQDGAQKRALRNIGFFSRWNPPLARYPAQNCVIEFWVRKWSTHIGEIGLRRVKDASMMTEHIQVNCTVTEADPEFLWAQTIRKVTFLSKRSPTLVSKTPPVE